VMAKIHLKRGNWDEAEGELRRALLVVPHNVTAREMMERIDAKRAEEREYLRGEAAAGEATPDMTVDHVEDSSWQTVTMADIFAKQGHSEKAREIYLNILANDPDNKAALEGIETLSA